MKKIFKNRLIIGLLSLLVAVLIIFVINPFFVEKINARVDVYEFARDLEEGDKINDVDIRKVSIAKENDKENFIKDKEGVVGKYIKKSVYAGDFISTAKISDKPIKGDNYLYEIPKGKRAMSVTITSFAKGLSAKLEKGDIIQVISATEDSSEAPNELRYVYLFCVTSPSGIDKDKVKENKELSEKDKLPKTATLLVGEEQAKKLALLEKRESIHIALVYRGNKEEANKLLQEQDDFIQSELEKKKALEEMAAKENLSLSSEADNNNLDTNAEINKEEKTDKNEVEKN